MFFMAAAATVVLAACNKDEVVEVNKGEAIGFSTLTQNATRATPITTANLTTSNTDFKVWGYLGATAYVNGVNITYQTTKWNYQNASDIAYWPGDQALDFYAVSPSSVQVVRNSSNVSGDNADELTFTMANTSQKFKYIVTESNADQKDVMYAVKKNHSKTAAATVPLHFKHALSQIVFKGKGAATNIKVDVEKITIHNLKNTGTFTLPNVNTANSSTHGTWALEGDATFDYPSGMKTPMEQISGTTAKDLTAADGAILILPQTPTKWQTTRDRAKTIVAANNDKECYLEIKVKVQQADTYILGSANAYGTAYIPFGEAWEPGKKYIYTLSFGGGFDDQGRPHLSPIMYTATVEDWVEDADGTVDLSV